MDSNWRKNILTYTVLFMAALVTLGAWFLDDKSVFNMAMGSWMGGLTGLLSYYFGASHKRNNGTDDNVDK
jgi:hypothetical protein